MIGARMGGHGTLRANPLRAGFANRVFHSCLQFCCTRTRQKKTIRFRCLWKGHPERP
jgi:hypothetical protein